MKFKVLESNNIEVFHNINDGVHNGQYVGVIITGDKGETHFYPVSDVFLDECDLRKIADKMIKIENENFT